MRRIYVYLNIYRTFNNLFTDMSLRLLLKSYTRVPILVENSHALFEKLPKVLLKL